MGTNEASELKVLFLRCVRTTAVINRLNLPCYDITSHILVSADVNVCCNEGGAEAAASRLSPEPAMSQVAAQHSSQGPAPSMAGSAVHAAEPRDVEGSSSGALPQGFFEVQIQQVSFGYT